MTLPVLFLTESLDRTGGWGRYAHELISYLEPLGCTPRVIVAHGGTGPQPWPVTALGDFKQGRLPAWFAARTIARQLPGPVALVHAVSEQMAPLAAAVARRLGVPYFVTLHGTYGVKLLSSGSHRIIYRQAFLGAQRLFAVSAYTARRVAALLPEAKIEIIHPGVTPVTSTAPPVDPLAGRTRTLITVGSIKPRKGTLASVEVFSRIATSTKTPVEFLMVGRFHEAEDYVETIRTVIARHRLEERVRFLGLVDDEMLDQLYARARGIVMASQNHGAYFEGFGLVHLEANQKGMPAIGSRDCGNEEAIADGISGFLVDQGDGQSLEHAMRVLLFDDARWPELSAGARKWATHFPWEDAAAQVLRAYHMWGKV